MSFKRGYTQPASRSLLGMRCGRASAAAMIMASEMWPVWPVEGIAHPLSSCRRENDWKLLVRRCAIEQMSSIALGMRAFYVAFHVHQILAPWSILPGKEHIAWQGRCRGRSSPMYAPQGKAWKDVHVVCLATNDNLAVHLDIGLWTTTRKNSPAPCTRRQYTVRRPTKQGPKCAQSYPLQGIEDPTQHARQTLPHAQLYLSSFEHPLLCTPYGLWDST